MTLWKFLCGLILVAVLAFVASSHTGLLHPGISNASAEEPQWMKVPFKLGNLGIGDLVEAKLKNKPLPPLQDLSGLKFFGNAGFSSMEDYVPWHWVEPLKDQFQWQRSDHHYAAVTQAGMKYTVFPVVQFVPDWLLREPDFQGFVCLEHNQATSFPSIWAPSTLRYYDRYYQHLADHFGEKISRVYVAGPSDFGEIAYPAGAAAEMWKTPHIHEGWWIGDRFARDSWMKYLQDRFQSVGAVNARWGTTFSSFRDITYPTSPSNRLQWLDFMEWYRSSLTDFTIKLVKIAKKYFPSQRVEIKLGHPYEKISYGTDIVKLIKAGSQLGFGIRSTAAGVPAEVYRGILGGGVDLISFIASRYATVTDFYNVPFITEEPAGLPKEKSLARIFIDASSGVSEIFMGPPSYMNAQDYYRSFGKVIRGVRPKTRVAFYYPLTDHLLKPNELFPPRLFNGANLLRDMMSYDVVDDDILDDGILDRYQWLVIFDNGVMKDSVLNTLASWVNRGGIIIHQFANQKPDRLEGSTVDPTWLFQFSGNEKQKLVDGDVFMKRIGKGGVVSISTPSSPSDFYAVVVKMLYRGNEILPSIKTEPLIDPQFDKVFSARFADRVLFFNSDTKRVGKHFVAEPSDFPGLMAPKEFTVSIDPKSIQEVSIVP